jgi:hypothetical protein
MARPKRRLSQAERDERRRRDRERLAEATRALLSSEGWRAWLRARATFHSYSLHNTLLIAHEAGRRGFTPTQVAGFKAWLRLGRCVRKGERGIAILAPVRAKQRDEHGDGRARRGRSSARSTRSTRYLVIRWSAVSGGRRAFERRRARRAAALGSPERPGGSRRWPNSRRLPPPA